MKLFYKYRVVQTWGISKYKEGQTVIKTEDVGNTHTEYSYPELKLGLNDGKRFVEGGATLIRCHNRQIKV